MKKKRLLLIGLIGLSIGLLLILTVGLVAARTEVVYDPASDAISISENQPLAADLINIYNAPSYRSQFGECYDVSIRDLAACQDTSLAPVQMDHAPLYRSQFGECYDVSIRDLAACHDTSLAPVQMDHSAVDECFDVSLWEVAECRSVSQDLTP